MNKLFLAATLVGSTALATSNVASGRAIVVNKCNYPVYLQDVPAAGQGGVLESPAPLQYGESWSQHYTGLTGDNNQHDGWSIKLSKTNNFGGDQLLQFEYTYQPTINADIVWLDVSSVDGANNPWRCEGWKLEASQKCVDPIKQAAAYMWSTDDTWGMQPQCPATGDFTITLCEVPEGHSAANCDFGAQSASASSSGLLGALSSGLSAGASQATSLLGDFIPHTTSQWSPPAAPTTTSQSTTSAAPAVPTTHATGPPAGAPTGGRPAFGNHIVDQDNVNPSAQPVVPTGSSTFVTSGRIVTEVETAWVTEYVTVDFPAPTHAIHKRHAHHGAHEHA